MIEQLVAGLPEIYQPIFGHSQFNQDASRPCNDRLDEICRTYDALQRLLGRPLKVLDLGCAQGFFSLNLAARGAVVHGVDFLDRNVALCEALAKENPKLHATFETGRVEKIIERLQPEEYDLVLGLSVFHHIIHEKGADVVVALLDRVANHTGALIVELAVREEPLYWAAAQPEDPRSLLESIAFVHEIARHATHLAPIPRPLFVASNRYWIFGGIAEQFHSWTSDPHALARGAHRGSRRYFFSTNRILKCYRFDHEFGERNKTEFKREVHFLQSPPASFPAPDLVVSGETEKDAWLVTQKIPGRLLLDLLREDVAIDRRAVLLAVLSQLAAAEAVGLYHDDVRTWNVLVADDGATHLIDYGSISANAQDCVWPGNPFLSFFIFVREISSGVVDDPNLLRTISISPYGLSQPYRDWATSMWQRPLSEWSFQRMYQTLLETPVDVASEPLQQPLEAWMKATEEAIQTQKLFANHIRHQANSDKQQYHHLLVTMAESHSREHGLLNESIKQIRAQEQQKSIDELSDKFHLWEQQTYVLQAERDALRLSWSWRITSPLRFLARLSQNPLHAARKSANFIVHRSISTFQRPISYFMGAILRRPKISYRINEWLLRYPALHQQLRGLARRGGAVPDMANYSPKVAQAEGESEPELARLTPRARQIYADLQTAIEKNKRNS